MLLFPNLVLFHAGVPKKALSGNDAALIYLPINLRNILDLTSCCVCAFLNSKKCVIPSVNLKMIKSNLCFPVFSHQFTFNSC